MKKYAGVGSRSCPEDVIEEIKKLAQLLAEKDWLLRSGGADGADLAFEIGCDNVNGKKEIFLPWKSFNKSISTLYNPTQQAFDTAATIHPVWDKLSYGAKKLHARNVHQVLGINVDEPADLLICWTPNGKIQGGTATAINLAIKYNIRVINLAIEKIDIETI